MAKPDVKLEELKEELRITLDKVKTRYAEMYFEKHGTVDYKKICSSSKNLITRVLNGTS